jgi:hypothetical protein
LLDVTIWRQERSITVHLVNLNTPNLFGGPVTEIVPVGRQELKVVLPEGAKPVRVELLRAKLDVPVNLQGDELTVVVPQVLDHEVVAIEIG